MSMRPNFRAALCDLHIPNKSGEADWSMTSGMGVRESIRRVDVGCLGRFRVEKSKRGDGISILFVLDS